MRSQVLDTAAKLGRIVVGMNKALGEIPVTVKLRTGVKEGRNTAHKLMPRLSTEWGVGCITASMASASFRFVLKHWFIVAWTHATAAVHKARRLGLHQGMCGRRSGGGSRQRPYVPLPHRAINANVPRHPSSVPGPHLWRRRLLLLPRLLGKSRRHQRGRHHDRTRRAHQAVDLYRNQGATGVGYQLAGTARARSQGTQSAVSFPPSPTPRFLNRR